MAFLVVSPFEITDNKFNQIIYNKINFKEIDFLSLNDSLVKAGLSDNEVDGFNCKALQTLISIPILELDIGYKEIDSNHNSIKDRKLKR